MVFLNPSMRELDYSIKTADGIVCSGPCLFGGFMLGDMDGVNDPSVAIYDGLDNSGSEVISTNSLDASALGLNGALLGFVVRFGTGCFVEIVAGGGTLKVTVFYKALG